MTPLFISPIPHSATLPALTVSPSPKGETVEIPAEAA
jgi:hypothetical protein